MLLNEAKKASLVMSGRQKQVTKRLHNEAECTINKLAGNVEKWAVIMFEKWLVDWNRCTGVWDSGDDWQSREGIAHWQQNDTSNIKKCRLHFFFNELTPQSALNIRVHCKYCIYCETITHNEGSIIKLKWTWSVIIVPSPWKNNLSTVTHN